MKTKEQKKLQTKELGELRTELLKVRKELVMLRLEKAQNKLGNTRLIFEKRKEIARILTILAEREIGAALAQKEKNEKST